jgi:hypothetical protein
MAQQLPEIRAMFTVAASTDQINVGTGTSYVNTGTYYTAGASGESNAYIDDIQTQIQTMAEQGNAIVNYYPANGGVVITLNTAAGINMVSSVAQALGFPSTTRAAAVVHGGTQIPRHVWRPTRGLSDHPVELNVFWPERSTTIIGRTQDGTSYSRKGNLLYDAEVSFDKLPRADVMRPNSGTIGRDLQSFFADAAHEGQILRWFPRRESNNLKFEALWGTDDDEEIGSWQDYYNRHVDPWFALFGVTIPFIKKV